MWGFNQYAYIDDLLPRRLVFWKFLKIEFFEGKHYIIVV